MRDESRLLSEVVAILAATAAVFAFLSFLAYQGAPANLDFTGRVGYGLADVAVQALGLAAYLGPAFLGVTALLLFRQASSELTIARAIGALVLILCVAILLAFAAPAPPQRAVTAAGGWIGGFLATLLAQAFGTPGSILIVGGVTILAFVFVTRISLGSLASLTLESNHDQVTFMANLMYVGRRLDSADGSVFLDEYFLLNLAATYEIDHHRQLFVRVDNVLGEAYDEVFGFGEAGFSAYAGVNFRW